VEDRKRRRGGSGDRDSESASESANELSDSSSEYIPSSEEEEEEEGAVLHEGVNTFIASAGIREYLASITGGKMVRRYNRFLMN